MTAANPKPPPPASPPPSAPHPFSSPPSPISSSPVILITGAARGLGAALAIKLSERGARLALVGLESDELAHTAAACDRARPLSTSTPTPAWHADVTDRTRMTEVAEQVRAHFGRIDVVVANAGIALGGPTADTDPQAFDRVIEVNLLGSIATARAFLPALIESKGYLLQIASLAAIAPAPLMAAYCASKSGVEAFAHCLRGEVAHQGVKVGVAYLTWTDTDMVRAADEDPVLKEMRSRLPWPANRTAPLTPAVERIATGIAKRKAHVYAQPWIRPLQWLPRAAVPQAVALRGQREVARLAPRLTATSHLRQRPLGPGGAAASAADRDPRQNQVANHPPA
ncbi:MAG TPA: SDR family oxidoreductase [Actinocrinis sp.]|nr:SDR family oxidoreductase [Actinocrinis sp.]